MNGENTALHFVLALFLHPRNSPILAKEKRKCSMAGWLAPSCYCPSSLRTSAKRLESMSVPTVSTSSSSLKFSWWPCSLTPSLPFQQSCPRPAHSSPLLCRPQEHRSTQHTPSGWAETDSMGHVISGEPCSLTLSISDQVFHLEATVKSSSEAPIRVRQF